MKKILTIIALFCTSLAFAQVQPTIPSGTVLGNNSGSTAAPAALTATQTKSLLAIAAGNVSGLAASATTDTTNAANISAGALPAGRLPALTGDCTTTVGTVATNCTKTGGVSFGAAATAATIGSGNVVLATSPTLVTPALGTPSAVVLTNATGLPNTALIYATTTNETSAAVTPTNFFYEPYDIRRYNAIQDNSTDNTTALANAALVLAFSKIIYIRNDTNLSYNYATSPNWDVGNGLHIIGYGNPVLKCTGTGFAFDMHSAAFGTTTDAQNEDLEDFTVKGNVGNTTPVIFNFGGIMRSTFKNLVADGASNASKNLAGVTITGTGGQFSTTATNLYVGEPVTISGTLGGTGSITGYSNPTTYVIKATNGTTTFTLWTLGGNGGVAIVTTAGTPTGLTYNTYGSVGFLLGGAISDTFLKPMVSANGGGSANIPHTAMAITSYLNSTTASSDNLILDAIFENGAEGLVIGAGARNTILGGTIESESDNGIIETSPNVGSQSNLVDNVDLEANTTTDITSYGKNFAVENSIGATYSLFATNALVLHDFITTINGGCFSSQIMVEASQYTTLSIACGGLPGYQLANSNSVGTAIGDALGSKKTLLNLGPNQINNGTAFTAATATGCGTTNGTPGTISGGPQGGTFVSNSSGTTCSIAITVNGADGATAGHAWSCYGADETTAVALVQSGTSTTTCTLKGTINATTDVIAFHIDGN